MKAILQKVPVTSDCSFVIQKFRSSYFDTPWHFHPELELVLVVQGSGKRFIGDHISNFKPGDLVLLGSNLPHWYRNDEVYYKNRPLFEAESLVIQFNENFLGKPFFEVPEVSDIKKLFETSVKGIEITGKTREVIAALMFKLEEYAGMDRLMNFLSILDIVSKSKDLTILSDHGPTGIDINESNRINKIYEYIMRNFTGQIHLHEIASIVNMSPSAFCRYFKKRTRKNLTFFVSEVRIGYACKLLIEGDYSITEICYMSGYNNVAFFNRQFKAFKKLTPREYKQEYLDSSQKVMA